MATLQEMNLARMLDKMAGGLADSLNWALRTIEKGPDRNWGVDDSEQWRKALAVLKLRRDYEQWCAAVDVSVIDRQLPDELRWRLGDDRS